MYISNKALGAKQQLLCPYCSASGKAKPFSFSQCPPDYHPMKRAARQIRVAYCPVLDSQNKPCEWHRGKDKSLADLYRHEQDMHCDIEATGSLRDYYRIKSDAGNKTVQEHQTGKYRNCHCPSDTSDTSDTSERVVNELADALSCTSLTTLPGNREDTDFAAQSSEEYPVLSVKTTNPVYNQIDRTFEVIDIIRHALRYRNSSKNHPVRMMTDSKSFEIPGKLQAYLSLFADIYVNRNNQKRLSKLQVALGIKEGPGDGVALSVKGKINVTLTLAGITKRAEYDLGELSKKTSSGIFPKAGSV